MSTRPDPMKPETQDHGVTTAIGLRTLALVPLMVSLFTDTTRALILVVMLLAVANLVDPRLQRRRVSAHADD